NGGREDRTEDGEERYQHQDYRLKRNAGIRETAMAKLVYHMATDWTGHSIAAGISGAHHADLRQGHTYRETVERYKNAAHLVQQVEKQRHHNHGCQLRFDKRFERIL